jgi:hypothetical protein
MADTGPQQVMVTLTERALVHRLLSIIDADPVVQHRLEVALSQALQAEPRAYRVQSWAANWQPDFLVLRFQFDCYPQREFFPNLTRLMGTLHGTL